ncbi:hypothetical protein V1979_34440, partial [Pseudomonas aeruginosa]
GTDRYNCYAVRPGYAESLAERIDWRALAPRPAAALGGELSEQALRGFLEARLPAYMLPSRIARVEREYAFPAQPDTAQSPASS